MLSCLRVAPNMASAAPIMHACAVWGANLTDSSAMQYDPRPSMPDATTAVPQVYEQPSYPSQSSAAQPHKVSMHAYNCSVVFFSPVTIAWSTRDKVSQAALRCAALDVLLNATVAVCAVLLMMSLAGIDIWGHSSSDIQHLA